MARDHKATYRRRQELARERGFKNYAEQRKIIETFNRAEMYGEMEEIIAEHTGGKPVRVTDEEGLGLARAYYSAFYVDPDNYEVNAPKFDLFVKQLHTMTAEEWKTRYPNGVRGDRRAA